MLRIFFYENKNLTLPMTRPNMARLSIWWLCTNAFRAWFLMYKVLETPVWILDIPFLPPVIDIDLNIIQVECIVKMHCFVS